MKPTEILKKIKIVNDSYTINQYDNGFMVDVSGRDDKDEWQSLQIIVVDLPSLLELVEDISDLPRQ